MDEPQGSHMGFWLQYIWLHLIRSHRPSLAATSVPLEEWNYNQKGKCSLFVSTVSAQGYCGHPELVFFSCLQVTR